MPDIDTNRNTKTAFTLTLTSLADGSSRQSTSIDLDSTDNFVEAFVMCQTTGQASGTDYCFVYGFGALDTSSNEFTDGAGATDAAFTTANILNAPQIGVIAMNATTAVKAGPFAVAAAFGGFLPAEFGLIVNNESGAALSATASDHDFEYRSMYMSSA